MVVLLAIVTVASRAATRDRVGPTVATELVASTEIHSAAEAGDERAVLRLLTAGVDANAQDADHYTPLHLAAGMGHEGVVDAMCKHPGIAVGAVDENGETPLHLAAQLGHRAVAQLLLDAGADINTPSSSGYTPLHMAAEKGHTELIQFLIDRGADVHASTRRQATPLHWAAYNGHAKAFLLLLNHGASLHARDLDGDTPMTLLQGSGDEMMLRELSHWVTQEKLRREVGNPSGRTHEGSFSPYD
ncbi:hypothetical protein AB1Y20_003146 [Prymnesium parvum]|uniref:Ankyrin repeat domain-containing protein n=1 Tax=Prymnesium parvum TaxID=97485 RepID=A0AB34JB09_PRYPA